MVVEWLFQLLGTVFEWVLTLLPQLPSEWFITVQNIMSTVSNWFTAWGVIVPFGAITIVAVMYSFGLGFAVTWWIINKVISHLSGGGGA